MYRKLLIGILAAQGLLTLNASVCLSGTLATYEGAAACSIGPLNFSFPATAFQLVSTTGSPMTATAADINLTPVDMSSGRLLGFTFTPTAGFSVAAGQEIEYSLTYDVMDPPIIIGGQLDMSDPITLGGSSGISDKLTPFGPCTTIPGPITLSVVSTGAPFVSDVKPFSSPTCNYQDTSTITLNAGPGGTADILTFTHEAVLPEPSYAFVIALASVLAIVSKRIRCW